MCPGGQEPEAHKDMGQKTYCNESSTGRIKHQRWTTLLHERGLLRDIDLLERLLPLAHA